MSDLVESKIRVPLDGSYQPNEDEFLSVEHFTLSDEMSEAVRDPIGVIPYQKEDDFFPEIKAIFVGKSVKVNGTETFLVAFQRFRKERYISPRGCNLFFPNHTFYRQRNFGISILDRLTATITEENCSFPPPSLLGRF